MATTVTNTPVTFNYTGPNGYISTVTYSYIPNGTSQISLSIDEKAAPTNPPTTVKLSPSNLPNGQLTVAYNQTITATGGTGPYTFAVNSSNPISTADGNNIYFANVVIGPTTAGKVTSKADWGPKHSGGYFAGDVVWLVATPAAGHTFNNWVVVNSDGTTFNDVDTSIANQISFYMPPNGVTVIANFDSSNISSQYLLPNGWTLSQSGVLAGTPTSTGAFTFTVEATDSLGNTGSQTYTLTVLPAALPDFTQPSPPAGFPPTPTADTKSYRYVRGISYVSPGIITLDGVPTNNQTVGCWITNTASQPVVLKVQDISVFLNRAPLRNIPDGTTVTLYDQYGNILADTSGYTLKNIQTLTLYYKTTATDLICTALVTTSNQGTAWIPVTTLSATGTGRIIEGSNHAAIFGPDVGNTGSGLFAGGNADNTYIRSVDFQDFIRVSNGVTGSLVGNNNFTYRLYGQGFKNPYYGPLITNTGIPTYGDEVGFGQIANSTAGTPFGSKILDTILEFTVVTPALIQDTTPLKLYTPYTYAQTVQSVWFQTVSAYAVNTGGYSGYSVDWGDGIVDNVSNPSVPGSDVFFVHSYSTPSNTPYSVKVSAYNTGVLANFNSGTLLARASLPNQYYVQDNFPEISLADYSKTLGGIIPVLPYAKTDIEVGSNEWAVADNINAALQKVDANFQYLNTISSTIRRTPSFELVQWLYDLIRYPTWNDNLSGSNAYFNLSSTYNFGVTPGTIVDFKSYKSAYIAPDYYNYITYSAASTYSFVEVRKNDFNNTTVLTLSSVIPNGNNINIITTDVSASNLYVLAANTGTISPVTLYRFNLDYINGAANIINQIGGKPGGLTDAYNFSSGETMRDIPSDIHLFNNRVYVGDKGNNCVKVYNSALTYVDTIYSQDLSAYNVGPFDVDPATNNVFLLGTLKAPNTPVIVNVQLSALDDATTTYAITWDHDGNRLASVRSDTTANFLIYGEVDGAGGNYSYIDQVLNPYLSSANPTPPPNLTRYAFNSTTPYIRFTVQALGRDQGFNSGYSSSTPTPNKDVFPSPYKVNVYNTSSTLLSSLAVPEVPADANVRKLLVENTGVFFYIVTDSYIYKYTTNGLFVNRVNNPSLGSSFLNEPIVTAFIDDRNYFYVATATRIFKFIDISDTADLFDITVVPTYYNLLSSYQIGENELIQDWVYNKAVNKVLKNHDILAKSIAGKYVYTVDTSNNLVSFTTRALSSKDVINSLSADNSSYVHSNEIVSSAVVNRVLDKIYDIQIAILNAVTPEIIVQPSYYTNNVLGKVSFAEQNVFTVWQYVQPQPIIIEQPASITNLTQGQSATLTFSISSVVASAVNYQWYYEGTVIPGASASTYVLSAAQLTDAGGYICVGSDNVGSLLSNSATVNVVLETLFYYLSACTVGNLYSSIYGTTPTRYGNDYTLDFNILNAALSSSLVIKLEESYGSTFGTFANPIYITVKENTVPIYSTSTAAATSITVPLSAYLATDSSGIQPDGYPGTYTDNFSITLNVGAVTAANPSIPKMTVTCSDGVLYNASFTNAIGATSDMSTSTLTVSALSGTMTYAGVTNNSLGGYINTNPYITHTWKIDGTSNGTNPVLYKAPATPHTYSTITATRTTTPGETEVTLAYRRDIPTTPTAPYYTLDTQSTIEGVGNGYLIGGGTYPAGTLVTVRAVTTYAHPAGELPPGLGPDSNNGPIIISGAGIWDVDTYAQVPTSGGGTIINLQLDPTSHSVSVMTIYIDGDKQIIGVFKAATS